MDALIGLGALCVGWLVYLAVIDAVVRWLTRPAPTVPAKSRVGVRAAGRAGTTRRAGVTPLELRYANRLLACFLFWVPTWDRLLKDLSRTGSNDATGNQEDSVSTSSSAPCGNPAGLASTGGRPFVDSDGGSGVDGHAGNFGKAEYRQGVERESGAAQSRAAIVPRSSKLSIAGIKPGLPPSEPTNRLRLYGMGRCVEGWRRE